MTLKTRIDKLWQQRGPAPESKPELTLEELGEKTQELFARAEADPDGFDGGDRYTNKRRADLARAILEVHQSRIERLAGAVGLDPATDFGELKAAGLALLIESGGRHRAVQRVFDEVGYSYWQTPEWAAFKETPARLEYED